MVPDAKVTIVPGRSSGVRFSVIIGALKQYVELEPYGDNQQPQSPPYGNYQQPAAVLPTIWPTLLITFFFGIFGIIPATMHTSRAREVGRPTNNYWATPTNNGSYTVVRRTH